MLRLMRKFSFMFIFYQGLYYLFLLPLLNSDRLTGPDPFDLSFVLYLNAFMFMIIIASIWAQEQLESKNNGDKFLQILPIKRNEVILAKYALAFLSILVYVIVHAIWLSATFDNPEYLTISYSNLMINTSVCLVLAGLVYLGFFRFGYERFGKVAIVTWVLMVIGPLPVRIILKNKFGIGTDEIVQGIMSINPLVMACAGLIGFGATLLLALRRSSWQTSLS